MHVCRCLSNKGGLCRLLPRIHHRKKERKKKGKATATKPPVSGRFGFSGSDRIGRGWWKHSCCHCAPATAALLSRARSCPFGATTAGGRGGGGLHAACLLLRTQLLSSAGGVGRRAVGGHCLPCGGTDNEESGRYFCPLAPPRDPDGWHQTYAPQSWGREVIPAFCGRAFRCGRQSVGRSVGRSVSPSLQSVHGCSCGVMSALWGGVGGGVVGFPFFFRRFEQLGIARHSATRTARLAGGWLLCSALLCYAMPWTLHVLMLRDSRAHSSRRRSSWMATRSDDSGRRASHGTPSLFPPPPPSRGRTGGGACSALPLAIICAIGVRGGAEAGPGREREQERIPSTPARARPSHPARCRILPSSSACGHIRVCIARPRLRSSARERRRGAGTGNEVGATLT